MSPFLERLAKSFLGRVLKEAVDKIFESRHDDKKQTPPRNSQSEAKTHPWRPCPIGHHFVREHPLTVPASSKGPEHKTHRRWSCHPNPSKKEIYTTEEFYKIAETHFKELQNDPQTMPGQAPAKFKNGNKYDLSIAGWVKFWNDTFHPDDPLTPDFVKALILSESSSNLVQDNSSREGPARGLLQITERTRKILQNPKGELVNHLIYMTAEQSREPEINIAAGVRWLHHKRYLLKDRIKRNVTWEEVGAEYKGIFSQLEKNTKADQAMEILKSFHEKLRIQRGTRPK